MSKQIRAKAKVQLVIEVDVAGWGEECQIGQLYSQAAKSGLEVITTALRRDQCMFRVVGEPKVIGVLTEYET